MANYMFHFHECKVKKGLRILIHDKQGIAKNTTINVVYKEVFANL